MDGGAEWVVLIVYVGAGNSDASSDSDEYLREKLREVSGA